MVNGFKARSRDLENISIKLEKYSKDHGKMTFKMEEAPCSIPMGINMKDIGAMVKNRDREPITINLVINMKGA